VKKHLGKSGLRLGVEKKNLEMTKFVLVALDRAV
jgi:hypothetical protein